MRIRARQLRGLAGVVFLALVLLACVSTTRLNEVANCANGVVASLPDVEDVRYVSTFTETFQSHIADECYFGRVFVVYETPLSLVVAQERYVIRLQELGWEITRERESAQTGLWQLVREETQSITIESGVGPLTRSSEDYQNATRLYDDEFTVTVECITPSLEVCGMR
jgi:hypothetical protein